MNNTKEHKNKSIQQFLNGMFKENPIFVLMLGMCPTLAVTTSATNGLGMGLTTTVVLVLSNGIISLTQFNSLSTISPSIMCFCIISSQSSGFTIA